MVLLNEIAEKVISKPEKMITSILDTIFDRHCEFLGDVLTKQVVHVHYSGPVLMIDLLGDYRVVILDKFIKGLHLFNSTESFDYNDSVKQMISKTITNINVEMLENYIKQSFHFLNKK